MGFHVIALRIHRRCLVLQRRLCSTWAFMSSHCVSIADASSCKGDSAARMVAAATTVPTVEATVEVRVATAALDKATSTAEGEMSIASLAITILFHLYTKIT